MTNWKRVAIREDIYKKLAKLAEEDNRLVANYLEHILRKILHDVVCNVKGE